MSDTTALDSQPVGNRDLLIAAVTFCTILLSATLFAGFFLFVLNVVALVCFAVPLVDIVRRS